MAKNSLLPIGPNVYFSPVSSFEKLSIAAHVGSFMQFVFLYLCIYILVHTYNVTFQSQCHFSDHIILQDVKNDLAVVEEHGTDDQCMTVQNPSQISGQRWTSASPSPQWGTEAGTIYLSYFTRVVVCGW